MRRRAEVPDPHLLHLALETLKDRYDVPEALAADPLIVPRAFADPVDREVAAWVAAFLAYGRVAPMLRAIRAALAPLGARPAHWLRVRDEAAAREALRNGLGAWVWRFHTAEDLVEWLLAWKALDGATGGRGVEPSLLPGPGEVPDVALSRLVQALRRSLPPTYGLRFNLADPLGASACKRWRMFLRWMVRRGWPDLGAWEIYPASELLIPADTHVARIARCIGLTARPTPDGRMAREITEALRQVAPEDPLRYDFALAHLGILGDCGGGPRDRRCALCPLSRLCHEA